MVLFLLARFANLCYAQVPANIVDFRMQFEEFIEFYLIHCNNPDNMKISFFMYIYLFICNFCTCM